MGNLFVVNEPFAFKAVWAVCKGFLDEKTRKKIKMLGSSYRETLLEYLNNEDIPEFLGGTSQGELSDDIGPWSDYELGADGSV